MDMEKLRDLFAQLKGIREILAQEKRSTSMNVADDYNSIVKKIGSVVSDDLNKFLLTGDYFYKNVAGKHLCKPSTINEKLLQLIPHLESKYNLSENIIEIGNIFDLILDEELKERCADILSASSNFDRVINQSTQVLEDRIRKKSKCNRTLVGANLVNKALNPDLSKTILVVSDNQDEHEGVCHICRGLMIGFRNPTHHHITDSFTREEALKLCAFIDNILQIIEKAKLNQNSP